MRLAFFFLLISCSSFAQEVPFVLTTFETTVKRLDNDSLRYYKITEIEDGVYFTFLIKPIWTKQTGILKNNTFKAILTDSISDGSMKQVYFYRADGDSSNLIVLAVHGFDDGLGDIKFFEYKNQELTFLGEIALWALNKDPFLGLEEVEPIAQMTVSKQNEMLILNFGKGKYRHYFPYDGEELIGPIKVIFKNQTYELLYD